MPGGVVTETIAFVQQISPQTQILILTAHLSSTEAQTLVNSGMAGLLLKEETGEKVVEAIRRVAEGKTWFSQRVMSTLLLPQIQEPEPEPTITLSERENEVLQLMVAGKSNKEMAQILNISARMVRRYLRQVYDKLRVNTRVEAAVRAVRLGLFDS